MYGYGSWTLYRGVHGGDSCTGTGRVVETRVSVQDSFSECPVGTFCMGVRSVRLETDVGSGLFIDVPNGDRLCGGSPVDSSVLGYRVRTLYRNTQWGPPPSTRVRVRPVLYNTNEEPGFFVGTPCRGHDVCTGTGRSTETRT